MKSKKSKTKNFVRNLNDFTKGVGNPWDPLGSYTGMPVQDERGVGTVEDLADVPTQDVDDL